MAILLSEGFEGTLAEVNARWPIQSQPGNILIGNVGGGTGTAFTLVTSPVFSGSQSLRYNYVGTQADTPPHGGGAVSQNYTQTSREIWLTWYSRMASGFHTAGGTVNSIVYPCAARNNTTLSIATKGLYTFMRSPSTGSVHGWVFHYFYGSRALTLSAQGIKDNTTPYGTQNLFANINSQCQPDDAWIGYEARFKLNTPGQADGIYELYFTNMTAGTPTVLMSRYLNREFVDNNNSGPMPGDSEWFESRLYRQDGLGSLYIDNFTVSTTRIGVSGTPASSDTTAPAVPTGLSVSFV